MYPVYNGREIREETRGQNPSSFHILLDQVLYVLYLPICLYSTTVSLPFPVLSCFRNEAAQQPTMTVLANRAKPCLKPSKVQRPTLRITRVLF